MPKGGRPRCPLCDSTALERLSLDPEPLAVGSVSTMACTACGATWQEHAIGTIVHSITAIRPSISEATP